MGCRSSKITPFVRAQDFTDQVRGNRCKILDLFLSSNKGYLEAFRTNKTALNCFALLAGNVLLNEERKEFISALKRNGLWKHKVDTPVQKILNQDKKIDLAFIDLVKEYGSEKCMLLLVYLFQQEELLTSFKHSARSLTTLNALILSFNNTDFHNYFLTNLEKHEMKSLLLDSIPTSDPLSVRFSQSLNTHSL